MSGCRLNQEASYEEPVGVWFSARVVSGLSGPRKGGWVDSRLYMIQGSAGVLGFSALVVGLAASP